MQPARPRTRQELYRDFVDFIRVDVQRERLLVHRKMFNVFLWCFLLPSATAASVLLLIKFNILPRTSRVYLDWVALVFPVCYSLYVLGSEVLSNAPSMFKRGGVHGTLGTALKDAEWRERVRDSMARAVRAHGDDWDWIVESYRMDLQAMQARTRYLTALAGAVFFLIMQGIDSISGAGEEASVSWVRNPITGWVETQTYDFSQFIGLTLFLVLLYLSGNQTYHSLLRYLNCAELNRMARKSGE